MKVDQRKSNLKEIELKVAILIHYLKENGYMLGAEKLADFVSLNKKFIKDAICSLDRVYIKLNDHDFAQRLVKFISKETLGDHIEWIQCADSEEWWLLLWWE